ncbi:MAG: uracil-DNA glycosylase [Chthoniobacterales bacterium]|nr:uracil-DNA glycosylase [Chthoniobacterales bacterium]
MTDPLQEAIHASLPLLKEIRKSLKPLPCASKSALSKLRDTAAKRPSLAPPRSRPAPAAPSPASGKPWTFDSLRTAILACEKCPHLVRTRTQVVFGVGNPNADLLFVGEAPGAEEDLQGEPFVGRAGQLLTKMIQAMGFERSDVFIANVLKCRPDMPEGKSGNRNPRADEMATCLPWLREQIALIQPRAIVALGAVAAEGLLGDTSPMRDLRGRWLEFQGIPVMVTYHPAYLLRNQTITEKRKVWEDLLLVLEKLGKKISAKQRAFFTKSAG